MPISRKVEEMMTRGSFIRKMFEEGLRMKAQLGADNVFDFSLGNPDLLPPPKFREALLDEAAREEPLIHCYMTNAGYEAARSHVAAQYRRSTGLPFEARDIIMSCGAGGALNVVLKSLLDPQDQVVVLAPFFMEYGFYVDNHGGTLAPVQTDDRFLPDLDRLDAALNAQTKAVIINSPNNPTGVVYPRAVVQGLGDLLRQASRRLGHTVYLISDEPYRAILYDGLEHYSPLLAYENTVIVTSHSKDLSLAGERIGHIAISPSLDCRAGLSAACTFSTRTLGFVNAGALMQRVVSRLDGVVVDVEAYRRRRDVLCHALARFGFDFVRPQGAFYLFPRSPLPDDNEFAAFMRRYHVIVVPGSGFQRPGYFRISYAVPDRVIERSLEYFEKAAHELGLRPRNAASA